MKIYQYSFYLTLLVFASSCVKEANIALPNANPKLVVTSFISPQDDYYRVIVSQSQPIFGTINDSLFNKQRNTIKDAVISLSDGNTTIGFSYSTNEDLYIATPKLLPLVPGQTYYLKVTVPDGRICQAHCIIPTQNNSFQISADRIDSMVNISLSWQSKDGKNNYFQVDATEELEETNNPGSYTVTYINFGNQKRIFSDNDSLLNNYVLRALIPTTSRNQQGPLKLKRVNGYLLHIDEPFYKYYLYLRRGNDDNPFAEPTLPYTNITDGLGVFAGYNKTTVSLEF